MKAGIVSTQHKWDAAGQAWANYHLGLGFSPIYLFIDGAPTSSTPASDAVKLIFCTPAYWLDLSPKPSSSERLATLQSAIGSQRWGTPELLMSRQIINADTALEQARLDGIDWLLHVDGDELFWCPGTSVRDHFWGMEYADIDQVTYINHEAILLHSPDLAPSGVTFFKRNLFCLPETHRPLLEKIRPGKPYFCSYANGKSAARVRNTGGAGGVHDFYARDPGRWHSALVSEQAVLHKPYDSMEHFIAKHSKLSCFPNRIFDEEWSPPGIYGEARDFVTASDVNGLAELFNSKVLIDDAEMAVLYQHGFVMPVEMPLPFNR